MYKNLTVWTNQTKCLLCASFVSTIAYGSDISNEFSKMSYDSAIYAFVVVFFSVVPQPRSFEIENNKNELQWNGKIVVKKKTT